MGTIGVTTVLPLKSTVLPVVIPPSFTSDAHWYTTVNTTGNSKEIFYGVLGKTYVVYILPVV